MQSRLALLVVLFFLAPNLCCSQEKFVPRRVLIEFDESASELKRNATLRVLGLKYEKSIPQINLVVAKTNSPGKEKRAAEAAKKRGIVNYADVDRILAPLLIPNDPEFSRQANHNLNSVRIPEAWDITTGSPGIIIAHVDGGVSPCNPSADPGCVFASQETIPNIIPGYNILRGNSDTSDSNGHGSGMARELVTVSNNSVTAAGLYWGKLMPIKITDDPQGYATLSNISAGIVAAADRGARVINLAYQYHFGGTASCYAERRGSLVVAPTGNDFARTVTSDDRCSVQVTGFYPSDNRQAGDYGPGVDIAAPFTAITSADRPGYYSMSLGTCSAAAHVSATAALIFSVNPGLSPQEVQNILYSSAVDMGQTGKDSYWGYGKLDARRAVERALNQTGDFVSPTVSITSPASGQILTGITTVSVNASDNVAVSSVSLSVEGNGISRSLGEDTSYPYVFSLDAATLSEGYYTLTATARDASGNMATSQINIRVPNANSDITPPTAVITSPSPGTTVTRNMTLSVSASDNIGVTSVALYVNGVSKASLGPAPYNFQLQTKWFSRGCSNQVFVRASDAAGNVANSPTIQLCR